MERHYRFLHKIKQALHERLKHKYAEMGGTDRLFIHKNVLVERICIKELTRLFEHGANSTNNEIMVDQEDPRIKRVKFEKFRAVLKDFRSPGQPFLTWNDIRELHSLCDDGNMKVFFQVLFAKSDQEFNASGADTEARLRATRNVPGFEYPATRTTVYPPSGWAEQKKKLMQRSATVPSKALQLEYVHGYNCESNGPNLFTFTDKDTQSSQLVFAAAGIVVIHDPATKKQKYFMEHSDDVVALCIDSTGSLCASGQVASIDNDGKSKPPLVYVWDVETLEILRTIDASATAANIQRTITSLCFSDDSSMLMVIGADDKHVVSVFDLRGGGAEFLADSPGQVGPPLQIHSIVSAPKIVSNTFGGSSIWITAGESSHLKFWLWKPSEPEPLSVIKGKFLKVTAPRVLLSICFMPKDDVIYVGAGDGRVLIFRYPGECYADALVHRSDASVYSLAAQKDGKHLWSGGSDHMLYQCRVKDAKFVKLRSYDFSHDGAGHLEIITAAEESDEFSHHPGSTKSDTFKKSGKSHRSKGSINQSVAMKSVAAIKATGGGERTGPNIRHNEIKVIVKDLVFVSQKNNKIEEEIGLVVATDGGSFWYVDWHRDIIDEIYYCHAGPSDYDRTMGGVQGVSPHPSKNAVFATCGEDRMMAVWDASTRERVNRGQLPEPAMCIAFSPQAGDHLAVGFHGGYVGVYDSTTFVRIAWHHRTSGDIEVIKYSPNGRQLATGSHENVIDLFDVKHKTSPYHHRKRLIGHSSGVVSLDWSADSKLLQSNCGAYEILYWDAIKGKNLRATEDSTESDTIWETWTCYLGFPVMGIWQKGWSRTDVNAVSRTRDMKLLVFGDDYGNVNLLNAPCIIRYAPKRVYSGHSSHVDDISFLMGDQRVISCGGRDKVLLQYRVVSSGELDKGTNLMLLEGTKGRLKTTKYGGGFADTTPLNSVGKRSSQLGRSSSNSRSGAGAAGGGGGGYQNNSDSDLSEEDYDEDYSSGGGGGGGGDLYQENSLSADDLLPLLAKHVSLANIPYLHAELAFVTLFCRDEALLIGRHGYALTSLCAAVKALDSQKEQTPSTTQEPSIQ
mmetsp:Transcript_286/g.349  ORF Transcript_286/g.349 Transcript_286/m.349 type:complete len:1072 (-) Transcript_286:246-3461(-)